MAANENIGNKGKQASQSFKESARNEERKVESEKGSHLKKGAERFEDFEERADGKDTTPRPTENSQIDKA